ncbi:MAG TPA: hypothetical protein VEO56_15630, partial [Bacteroidota bacterium]|nr:hypothetical protein [Bacteroidota bacterium]
DLLRLPAEALNAIRRPFAEQLGVELDGPGGVGMYIYGGSTEGTSSGGAQYVLYNMSDETAPMKLRFFRKVPQTGWKELVSGEELTVTPDTAFRRFGGMVISDISISVKPFDIVVIQAP